MPDALERGLLFGVLAVREDLVDRAALLEAMNVWIGDGTRCLEQIIRQRHRLTDEQLLLLDRKVAQVLDRTEVDPRPLFTEVGPGVVRGDSLPTEPENGLAKPWDGGRTLDGDDPGGHDATLAPGSSSPPSLSAVAPGSRGVRYRILELLARGGLGEVYVARDEELDRLVALKLMQDRWANDPVSRDRFLLEAGITSALEHPGIVPVHGLGLLSDGRPYYTMKLVKGEPLKDAILEFHRKHDGAQAPGERMPELRQLLRRFLDVCHVIDYAHSRKILHRDLKPANILLGEYAETLVVDWGLAKDLERGTRVVPAWTASSAGQGPADATLGGETVIRIEPTISDDPSGSGIDHSTLPGSTLGTPNYMSPEQAAGWTDKIGPASDIYGLGATLYFLLTGVPPCDGPDLSAILTKVRAGEITPPRQLRAWVPETLAAICLKALARKPEDRYESPHALAGDIEHWLADEPVAIHRDPVSVRLTRWGRRHRSLAVAVGVLLVSAVFGLTLGTLLLSRANLRVQESARTLERQLYIHRVNLAYRECIEGSISHAERLLSLCPVLARDWEWYYVARLCHRERSRFRGHRECVSSVAFTRDGTRVLSGAGRPFYKANRDDEAELILWESATGRELRRFQGLKGSVHGVAISPDGKWFASASGFYDKAPEGEGRLRIWDAVTGAVVLERTEPFLNALTVAFSPDGRHVAVGFGLYSDNNFPGHFMVLEVTTGQVVLDRKITGSGVNALAFHPDCKRLAVGGTGAIELWDIAKKEKLHDLPGHESWVYSVAFHPDGLHLISGGWDRTVRIWDLPTRKEVRHIAAHAGNVLGVAVDRDGRWVASCGDDNVIKLWDAATGRALTTLRGHASQIPGILGLAFSPDGKTLASAGGDRAVMLWDVTPDEQVTFHDQKGWITSLLCLSDNRTVVSGSGDHSIALWDADTGRLVRELGSHLGWVLCLALSPDGKLLASGGADSVIRLWDLAAGKEIKVLNGSRSFVRGLAFSPDGKFLVSAGGDQSHGPNRGEVNRWEVATGKLERTLLEETLSCNSLAFSPDGRSLAVAVNSREGPDPVPSKVVILDWPSGRILHSLVDTADPAHDAADFPSGLTVVFSPGGGRLAVDGGGGTVKLYDPSTGKLERTLRGHATQMGSLAFSPSGRRLISSNFDRLIKVWDTSTGEELLSLRGHDGGVVSLAFSPDGHRLLSGGVEHTARVWDARPLEHELDMSDDTHK